MEICSNFFSRIAKQNDVAERKSHHILETTLNHCFMLVFLLIYIWVDALVTTVSLMNIEVSPLLTKHERKFEKLFDNNPNMGLKVVYISPKCCLKQIIDFNPKLIFVFHGL